MNYNQAVTDYINGAPEDQIEIMETLRKIIHASTANVSEAIKWKMPVFNNSKDFCYLRFSKKHITLGFYNIDKIKDPEGRLEGSGNTLRHVKIKTLDDIDKALFSAWLKAIAQ